MPGVELVLATKEHHNLSAPEMVDFYNSIDCYVCVSESEGQHLPLLEAGACGLPRISTDVGIASELIEPGKNGLIVERSVEHVRRAGFTAEGYEIAVLGDCRGTASGSEYQVLVQGFPSGGGPPVHLDRERALVDLLAGRLNTATNRGNASDLTSVRPLTAEQVQKMLPTNLTLLEYYFGGDTLFLWVVDRQAMRRVSQRIPRSELRNLMSSYR